MEPTFRAYVARVVQRAITARAHAAAALQHSRELRTLNRARARVAFNYKLQRILHGDKRVA